MSGSLLWPALLLGLLGCGSDVSITKSRIDADGDGYSEEVDCDDAHATVNPDAEEVCDELDNDCDGTVDEDPLDPATWYTDADGDGYGDLDQTTLACAQPEGAVADGSDCDDGDEAIHPGAEETDCTDSTDYNCDGSGGRVDADGDGAAACEDCDDGDASRSPALAEVCDEDDTDEDCDGLADDADEDAGEPLTWYRDQDGDGYASGDGATLAQCDAPTGYSAELGDCDDLDANVSPAAAEICDEADADEDCDGLSDDDDPTVDASTWTDWFRDDDSDDYGDPTSPVSTCDAPAGFVADDTDCDDGAAGVNPGADEICDPADTDEDCDGLADDADPSLSDAGIWYDDLDGDGYGDPDAASAACDLPAGFVADDTDCDDGDDGVNPGATEICDAANVDEDCDGLSDDADAASGLLTWYRDRDSDGYASGDGATLSQCDAPTGYSSATGDCDDLDASVSPGATEICDDANTDEDCDDLADDDDPTVDASTWTDWYRDDDSDEYGDPMSVVSTCDAPAGFVADDTDCDDGLAAINPGADEICDPADTDEDCDGLADDADPSLTDAGTWYDDRDGDGYGDPDAASASCDLPADAVADDSDCDDGDDGINPDAVEICDAFDTDEDCDGLADDADSDATGASTWYADEDSDGYGAADNTVSACSAPSGTVANDDDCDDALATAHPGGTETCATAGDEDCDGSSDEAGATGCSSYYTDADGDDYGTGSKQCLCAASGSVSATNASDCDDADEEINPAAREICGDGVDQDCSSSDPSCPAELSGSYATGDTTGSARATIEGAANGDLFGYDMVATDLDGDGDEDLVIGAYGNNYSTAYGMVYRFDSPLSGSLTATSHSDGRIYGNTSTTGYWGSTVGSLGDIDGDGRGDIAAMLRDASGYETAYLFDGEDFSSTKAYSSASDTVSLNGDQLSWSALGDTDGSGEHEYAVANPDAYTAAVNVAVYSEGSVAAWYSGGGYTVAGGPGSDVDGDGFDDMFVGAPQESSQAGAVYVLLGPFTASGASVSTADLSISGPTSGLLGMAVGAPGDVDGDGLADVVAGAPHATDGGSRSGNVYLWTELDTSSGASMSVSDAVARVQGDAGDYLGYDCCGRPIATGDEDGDGEGDLLLGTYNHDSSSKANSGVAWLFYGPISGTYLASSAYDAAFSGDDANDDCGISALLADLDGDDNDEVVIGCDAGEISTTSDPGVVYVFDGG